MEKSFSQQEINAYAQQYWEVAGQDISLRAIDVKAIVTELGGTVIPNAELSDVAPLVVLSSDKFRIHNPTHTTDIHDRFFIAQQLGYLRLFGSDASGGSYLPIYATGNRTKSERAYSNRFAHELLLPAKEVSSYFADAERNERISKLVQYFKVGETIIKSRLVQLGVL